MPTLSLLSPYLHALPEAALLAVPSFVFGVLLKLSDLLQEHGYRWFRGAAVTTGAAGAVLLCLVLGRADELLRSFWLAVLLHWVLRGRIDGVNHGIVTTAALVALAVWSPSLLPRNLTTFLYFAVPLTVLGLVHDVYQYEEPPGPAWLKAFFKNQHLYWYLVILGHPLVAPPNLPFAVAALAFVKGYGLLYSERVCALLPRAGIRAPS